jgi:hypothetical protein
VLHSYYILAQALLQALHRLDIPPRRGKKHRGPAGSAPNPVCFEMPPTMKLLWRAKNWWAAPRHGTKDGVLQHGSLLSVAIWRASPRRWSFQMSRRQSAAERLLRRATTAESILGRPLNWAETAQAFETAFAETANLDLQPGELTPDELARRRTGAKYGNKEWTGGYRDERPETRD